MQPDAVVADITITWAAATGVLGYMVFLWRRRVKSAIESKTLFLLYCLAILFAVRGVYWKTGHVLPGAVAFVAASFLPLASTLFVEGLMRRHAPPWFKWMMLVATPLFLATNLYAVIARDAIWLAGFVLFLLFGFGYLGVRLARRDRTSLSSAENDLVGAVLVTAVTALLFAATDFRTTMIEGFPVRLGAIGGLVFVYVLSTRQGVIGSNVRAAKELGIYAGFAGVLALPFIVLFGVTGLAAVSAIWGMVFSLILMMIVVERLRHRAYEERLRDFRSWILGSGVSSMDELLMRLREASSSRECLLIESGELADYETTLLCHELERAGGVIDRAATERMGQSGEPSVQDAAEQLVDLLRCYEMTHVCLVCGSPCSLLLFNLPQIGGGVAQSSEPQLVYTMARLLDGRAQGQAV